MTISWTDAAIEAAIDAFYEGSDMRAALDAAVKAQGLIAEINTINEAIRATALEEAAKVAEETIEIDFGLSVGFSRMKNADEIAAAIRALKEKKG